MDAARQRRRRAGSHARARRRPRQLGGSFARAKLKRRPNQAASPVMTPSRITIAVSLLFSGACAFAATNNAPPALQLPDTVRPVRYAVDLTIVPGKNSFTGAEDIDIDIREPESL